MATFPGASLAAGTRRFLTEDRETVLTPKRILALVLAVTVVTWAALHPPTRVVLYPPGTLIWTGVDEFA